MEFASTKTFLLVGSHGCGKTALVQRISKGVWSEPKSTIGLDQNAGLVELRPDGVRLRDDLQVMMPAGGVEARFWEIGGKDCKLRAAPRGQPVDGLLLCYDVGNRSSFQAAAQILMQHRTDRYNTYERATLGPRSLDTPGRLVVALCGTKADEADENGGCAVSTGEQMSFVESSGLCGAFVTSAKTGEGVEKVLQALVLASLEAEEEVEAERMLADGSAPAGEMFSLTSPFAAAGAERALNAMSSPRGLRPHEPSRGRSAASVVEVIDNHGTAYGARPLLSCLELGLLHRVVHVWLVDPRNGGVLLRRYSLMADKEPNHWGPSARGEVLCYEKDAGLLSPVASPKSAELSFDAARRVLSEQLGFESNSLGSFDFWGSVMKRHGNLHEFIEIYAVDVGPLGLPDLQMRQDEEVEWCHFTDVFSSEEEFQHGSLFHIPNAYRAAMVQKMRVRVEHAYLT